MTLGDARGASTQAPRNREGLVRYHTPSFAEALPDGCGRCLVCGALVDLAGFFAGGCPLGPRPQVIA